MSVPAWPVGTRVEVHALHLRMTGTYAGPTSTRLDGDQLLLVRIDDVGLVITHPTQVRKL